MDRRKFLVFTGITLTPILHDWLVNEPAVAYAVTHGGQVGSATLDRVEAKLAELRRADDVLGGGDLLAEVQAHLATVVRMLSTCSYSQVEGGRLFTAAAELGRLACWINYDAFLRPAGALRYFHSALRAAHSSGDRLIGANVLASAARVYYTFGAPQDADQMIQTARAGIRGHSTPKVEAILSSVQARALSKAGDAAGCHRALNAAFDQLAQGTRDNDPDWAYWVNPSDLHANAGSCFAGLGDPQQAVEHFVQADAAYATEYVRDNVLRLTRMAEAQLHQGDVEQACASGSASLSALGQVTSVRCSNDVRAFLGKLAPYSTSPTARDVLDQARELGVPA